MYGFALLQCTTKNILERYKGNTFFGVLTKGLLSDLVVHTLNAFSYNEYEKETQLIFLILNTLLHANALY